MIFSEKIGLSTQTILFEILSFFPQPFAQEIDIYIVNIVFGLLDSQCCGQTGGLAGDQRRGHDTQTVEMQRPAVSKFFMPLGVSIR